ncbi:protease modulator HflC [Luteimonas huabeiensis]|uniref:protease modulator HflC n=1 Tax=Luteimonas huabeiensis TaxID=1244513 RepID=UPI000465952B|nr:protease modulator HflC [Luteimonas huabeiensis]
MNPRALIPVLLVAVLLGLLGSVYVVREGQVGLVLQLGRVVRSDVPPGLHFKIPLMQTARVFDRRFNAVDFTPERYLTSERKDVSVDFVAIVAISDVADFYRATYRGGGSIADMEARAADRLAPIIKDSLRNEINARTLTQLVSGDRGEVIAKQLESINQGAATLGMRIIDIRLKQIDLPTDSDVIQQVYNRMRAERKQVASRLRAEGEEQARLIRAQADRDQAVILAEAERDAQTLRGEGDAEAARIYGEAANRDPAFFAFQRSLDAYRRSFEGGDSVIVLERDDPFLQYMRSDR